MMYKANIRPAWVVLVLIVCCALSFALVKSFDLTPAGNLMTKKSPSGHIDLAKFRNSKFNEDCLKCHGQSKYAYQNSETKKTIYHRMYAELIIKRDEFYVSNHREFKCTDCHSEDYGTFPHPGNLRMESKPNCLDCHGGDEKYAKYKFEKIDSNFMASVHSLKHSQDFTCWMCHNPHTYKINARTNESLQETITYDNLICLGCHGDLTRYELLTNKKQPSILDKHEWLPNQASHFTHVRCIECHTSNKDTLTVAHQIVPKNLAVKKCESCHAENSILYASLFKYRIQENIKSKGWFKGLLLSETATIGPDQDNTLNIISFIIFGFTLSGILIHAFLRVRKSH